MTISSLVPVKVVDDDGRSVCQPLLFRNVGVNTNSPRTELFYDKTRMALNLTLMVSVGDMPRRRADALFPLHLLNSAWLSLVGIKKGGG